MKALLLRSALMLGGLALAGLAVRLTGFSGNLGANGPLAFVVIGAILCAAGAPRQVVAYAGGAAFGVWAGALLALLGQVLGAVVGFVWARAIAREWARRRIARAGPRLARIHATLLARPFVATLALRLSPFSNNLALTLLAGVAGVRGSRFLAASALGYIPQTVVFALIGDGVQVDARTQVGLAVALFVASIGLGALLLRWTRVDTGSATA